MFHKLKDFLSSLGKSAQNTPVEDVVYQENLTRRQRAERAVEELTEVRKKKSFSYKKAATVSAHCCSVNLVALVDHLHDINTIINERGHVTPFQANAVVELYTVRKLITHDGYYLPMTIIELFCQESVTLCEKLKEGDGAFGGMHYYNQRVLAIQLGTIREVATAIKACYE